MDYNNNATINSNKKIRNKNNISNGDNKQNQTDRNTATNGENISPIAKCKLLQHIYNNKQIIVFGSIHKEEFFHLVWQYTMIAKKINCIAIFVPRYVSDSYKLAEIMRNNNLTVTLWSSINYNNIDTNDVIIVDELGVLMNIYNICNMAVVCGSFAENIGGHNPIEPIVFSKITFIGEHCCKCQDLVTSLLNNDAVVQTRFLYEDILKYTSNATIRDKLIANGVQFIEKNIGAVNRIFNFIF